MTDGISVVRQDACPACISRSIEFARDTRVLSTCHNPQRQLWLLFRFGGIFVFCGFFLGGKYFLHSLTVCQFKIGAAATLERVTRGCLVLRQEQPSVEACRGVGQDTPLCIP